MDAQIQDHDSEIVTVLYLVDQKRRPIHGQKQVIAGQKSLPDEILGRLYSYYNYHVLGREPKHSYPDWESHFSDHNRLKIQSSIDCALRDNLIRFYRRAYYLTPLGLQKMKRYSENKGFSSTGRHRAFSNALLEIGFPKEPKHA